MKKFLSKKFFIIIIVLLIVICKLLFSKADYHTSIAIEEAINTELGDKFALEYSYHQNSVRTIAKIRNCPNYTIITEFFVETFPEKEYFKLIKNTPNLRCYYIHNCLLYRFNKQKWKGVHLLNFRKEGRKYTGIENLPGEIILLGDKFYEEQKVNENLTWTELDDEFIIEYSRLPTGDPENGTTIKIKHPQSRNTIVSIGPVYNAKMEDFQTLLNTPEMRCYRIYDCLIYMANYTDKGKWEGIPLDFLKHEESYYWPLKVPEEIRDVGKQILQEERRN